MSIQMNAQYFIDKFTAIPDDEWITGSYTDPKDPTKHCAMGHCSTNGDRISNPKVYNLMRIIKLITQGDLTVANINDCEGMASVYLKAPDKHNTPVGQALKLETPKARIIAVLEIAKEGGL